MLPLLTPGESSPKLVKLAKEFGIESAILYMLPDKRTCPWAARNQCLAPCLIFQGRARFTPGILPARERRREEYFADPNAFLARVSREIESLIRRAARHGLRPTVRLDGGSDLGLAFKLAPTFPSVQFWDYTKGLARVERLARAHARGELLNHHLTFSRGADNDAECMQALALGTNVAVAFDVKRKAPLPAEWQGIPVIDGDTHDYRFRDPTGVVVGLRAKGQSAKLDKADFFARA